jgi:hypothetical protein
MEDGQDIMIAQAIAAPVFFCNPGHATFCEYYFNSLHHLNSPYQKIR